MHKIRHFAPCPLPWGEGEVIASFAPSRNSPPALPGTGGQVGIPALVFSQFHPGTVKGKILYILSNWQYENELRSHSFIEKLRFCL